MDTDKDGTAEQPAEIPEVFGRKLDTTELADIIWLAAEMLRDQVPKLYGEDEVQDESSEKVETPVTQPQTSDTSSPDEKKLLGQEEPKTEEVFEEEVVEEPIAEQAPAYAQLPTQQTQSDDALSFTVSSAPALSNKLALARALRPLKQTIPSVYVQQIDEVESAERSAETNTTTIVLRPQKRRWFDIAIVIDESPSMAMWHRTINEFITLLIQLGAFRNVSVYGVVEHQNKEKSAGQDDTNQSKSSLRLHHTVNGERKDGHTCQPSSLLDPRGERITLIITDTSHRSWYTGEMAALLSQWTPHQPVVLLHMLPRYMWKDTTLVNQLDVILNNNIPGVPNSSLNVTEWPWYWDMDDEEDRDEVEHKSPIPVILLQPFSLEAWANLVAGKPKHHTFGYYFFPALNTETIDALDLTRPQVRMTAEQAQKLFKQFLSILSPSARKLAAYLAGVPITLEIVRIVQQEVMGKEAQQIHIAELFYSGLLCQISSHDPHADPEESTYDFYGGLAMRDEWQLQAKRTQSINVFDMISKYVTAKAGQGGGFRAILTDQLQPHENGDPLTMRFAEIAARSLLNWGPDFAEWAKKLAIASQNYDSNLTYKRNILKAQKKTTSKPAPLNGFALLIGINEYLNGVMPPIPQIVDENRILYQLLTDEKIGGYKADQVRVIEQAGQKKATRTEILNGIAWLADQLNQHKDATGLLIFGGYGQHFEKSADFYLMPSDAQLENGADSLIDPEMFIKPLINGRFANLAIILDCSHAAGFGRRVHELFEASKVEGEYAILCSTSEDEKAYNGYNNTMGKMIYHVIAGLHGADQDSDQQFVTVRDLWEHVHTQMTQEEI